jgi:hypothetical protein
VYPFGLVFASAYPLPQISSCSFLALVVAEVLVVPVAKRYEKRSQKYRYGR